MLKTLLLFLIIQFNDTVIEDLRGHVQQKYGTDSTFVFQKLTTFPILKGAAYYWHYYPYDFRNKNVIFLKENYIIGIRFTFYDNGQKFYLYQAEKYKQENSLWVLKRQTRVLVNSLDFLEILLYSDEEF